MPFHDIAMTFGDLAMLCTHFSTITRRKKCPNIGHGRQLALSFKLMISFHYQSHLSSV